MIEASIKIRLKPWNVPNFASADGEQGGEASGSVALREIDETALTALVQRWLDDLYAKTDYQCPFVRDHEAA